VVVGLEAELWNGFKLMETRQFVAKVNYSRDPSDQQVGWLRGVESFETLPSTSQRDTAGNEGWFFLASGRRRTASSPLGMRRVAGRASSRSL